MHSNIADLRGKTVELNRAVDALLIPDAYPVNLDIGSSVYISQSLGSSYTVIHDGKMLRIAGEDAGALGPEFVKAIAHAMPKLEGSTEDMVWAFLKTCYDPEIPVSIVELGLIYAVNILAMNEDDSAVRVHVVMTLTAPGCGMGPVLVEEIKQKLQTIGDVQDVVVELVFDPPWTQDMMDDAAKLALGIL
jgi:probable FeS assembly SUF system protein SufT